MASTTAASNLLEKTFFGVEKNVKGAQLPLLKAPARNGKKNLTVAMASKKKVNAYDDQWTKTFFSYGYFAENSEEDQANILKKVEKKKLLSTIEKAGLLSKLEEFGFSLSKIEKLGLLSKAESLGLLSLAEKFASTSPGTLASLSLPLVVGAVLTPIIIPDDTLALVIGQYTLAAAFGVAGVGAFGASIILSLLLEE